MLRSASGWESQLVSRKPYKVETDEYSLFFRHFQNFFAIKYFSRFEDTATEIFFDIYTNEAKAWGKMRKKKQFFPVKKILKQC